MSFEAHFKQPRLALYYCSCVSVAFPSPRVILAARLPSPVPTLAPFSPSPAPTPAPTTPNRSLSPGPTPGKPEAQPNPLYSPRQDCRVSGRALVSTNTIYVVHAEPPYLKCQAFLGVYGSRKRCLSRRFSFCWYPIPHSTWEI